MKKTLLFIIFSCTLVIISCHKNEIDKTTNTTTIANIHENAIQQINDQLNNGNDLLTAVNNCIESIKQSPDVKMVKIQDDNIVINYNSGAISVIALVNENVGSEDNKSSDLNSNNYKNNIKSKSEKGIELITNHNVLIWEPFFDGFGVESHTGSWIQSNFENSSLDFTVTHLTGDQCTITSLNNLTQYGFVFINTHGGASTEDGEDIAWIMTGEKIPMDVELPPIGKIEKIAVTIAEVTYGFNSEIVRLKHGGFYWGVTNKYITKYVNGQFSSPAIVFVEACYSYSNAALRNAFIEDKKASAYLGFKNPQTHRFGYSMAMQFTQNLLFHKMDADQAYSSIPNKHDNSWVGLLLSITGNRTEFLYSTESNSNPTYFPTGYVECPALSKRWKLTDAHYFPAPYQNTTHFSQLQFGGPDFQIVYRLSKMNSLAEGTYDPYVINDIGADTLWETNFYPMRFLAGTYSGVNGSSFWHEPETHYYSIRGGELKYQKQNNLNKFTFDIIGDDGHSYHGEFAGEIHQ